jgi:hypothetical protein
MWVFILYLLIYCILTSFSLCISGSILEDKINSNYGTVITVLFYLSLLIYFQPPLSISENNMYHVMIGMFLLSVSAISNITVVTILLLEHACVLYASPSKLSYEEILNRAYSQLMDSNIYNALTEQFLINQSYSIDQFVEFILNHRL